LQWSGRFATQARSLAGKPILAEFACIVAGALGAVFGELFAQRADKSRANVANYQV
jgi:hypothetical protein